ncbi:MAG: lipoate--protein ligase family protein, partial [Gammaproteobacteria bacterium]|nr:lipoate--protein ligase family protein [Gammaproteobacteria bacterium]
GRKISGTGGFYDGDVLIYQGTVLVDLNPQRMVSALRVPRGKLAKRDLDSAAQRVVTLKELLGPDTPDLEFIKIALLKGFKDVLGVDAEYGAITEGEEELARQYYDEEIGTEEFLREIDNPAAEDQVLAGTYTGAGGTIDAFVKLEGPTQSILQRVLISGDFFVTPPRIVFDLEAALQGVRLDEVEPAIEQFFDETEVDTLSVAPSDFKASIANALEQGAANG